MPRPSVVHIAFGSNIRPWISTARLLRALAMIPGVTLEAVSPVYRTSPVGGPRQADFLNGVVRLRTDLEPTELLARLLELERRLGRRRRRRWGPRVADLDILAWGRRRIRRPGLSIPHPRYHLRRFVLAPFTDLAPRFVHPVLGRSNRRLLRELTVPDQIVTMAALWKKTRFQRFAKRKPSKPPSSR